MLIKRASYAERGEIMIHAIKGDITKISYVQAIVNAANESLLGGGGVDGAIHYAAGPDLLEECKTLGGCQIGEAKITKGYNLPCEYIIHTVGPRWHGGERGEAELLASCYLNSLKIAMENGIRKVAFPSISTGAFGYPVEKAAKVAVETVNQFLCDHSDKIEDVYWVLFDNHTLSVYENEIKSIRDAGELYIDKMLENPDIVAAFANAMNLGNLGVIAPHKKKYYDRYSIQWLIDQVDSGAELKFITFWQADSGCENREFSQWFQGEPFIINGRKYYTAEQYMMSEKALFARDYEAYDKIMKEKSPAECKSLGRKVKNLDGKEWGRVAREVIFHGNLGKFQADISLVDKLLSTGDAILIEASPYDNLYGSGIAKENLLNPDGSLKVHPKNWHTEDNLSKLSENKLGFVLMGIRDLFRDLMPKTEK